MSSTMFRVDLACSALSGPRARGHVSATCQRQERSGHRVARPFSSPHERLPPQKSGIPSPLRSPSHPLPGPSRPRRTGAPGKGFVTTRESAVLFSCAFGQGKTPGQAGIGTWRSLVAHLTGGQGVAGSNPVVPTTRKRGSEAVLSSMGGRPFVRPGTDDALGPTAPSDRPRSRTDRALRPAGGAGAGPGSGAARAGARRSRGGRRWRSPRPCRRCRSPRCPCSPSD